MWLKTARACCSMPIVEMFMPSAAGKSNNFLRHRLHGGGNVSTAFCLCACLSVCFRATVCKTVYPMLSDRCLSPVCLSVTLVYCGQTAGWIKMPLGVEVGLGLGHTVLDRDSAPPQKGEQQPPLFGPCLLWPNGRHLSNC